MHKENLCVCVWVMETTETVPMRKLRSRGIQKKKKENVADVTLQVGCDLKRGI